MTASSPATARTRAPTSPRRRRDATVRAVAVELLICGSSDRGDDGAAIAAIALIEPKLPTDVRLRVVGTLDIDDLLRVAPGAGVVVVDAAIGIAPGAIVSLPLGGLIGREGLRPRSSHAMAFPEVLGLANMLRSDPLRGEIVAIGGKRFGLGKPLTRPVAAALPAFVAAVLGAVERARPAADVVART